MREASSHVFLRMILFLVALLSVWLIILSRKERERSSGIETDIDRLKREASLLQEDNKTLKEKIEYFSSDVFQEREAKEKLGYRKANERVVILHGEGSAGERTQESSVIKDRGVSVKKSNREQWFDLFR